MKFLLKLALQSLLLFILAFTLTVCATRYHYSSLLSYEQKVINEQLPKLLAALKYNEHPQLKLIKNQLKLKHLEIDNNGSRDNIHFTLATKPRNLAQFLLYPFFQEQQIQLPGRIIRYRLNTSALFTQFHKVVLAQFLLFLATFIIYQILQYLAVKKLQGALIEEINSDKLGSTGFDLVSAKLSQRKNKLYFEIKQQQQQINDLLKQMEFDQLTGLYNRKSFRLGLHKLLDMSSNIHSALIIIRATALDDINQHDGHQLGDIYLQEVAAAIRLSLKSFTGLKLYRICGGDFSILATDTDVSIIQDLVTEIHNQFDAYQELHELNCVGHIGFTLFSGNQQPEQIIGRADLALAKAQTQGANAWAMQLEDESHIEGEHHWKTIIEQIIATQQVEVFEQKISGISAGMINYRELYSHFHNNDGSNLSSTTIFTMAERLDLSSELEKMILRVIFKLIEPKDGIRINWGIALSSTSIQNSAFVNWLSLELKKRPEISSRLIFEVNETVLERHLVASQRLFATFGQLHCRTCIKKFGRGVASFKLFKSLKPDMVKVDANLLAHIHKDSANQQFVRMLVDVAHRMNTRVIAEGVEGYEQKQVLESMNFDALQGYYISKPLAIFSVSDDA